MGLVNKQIVFTNNVSKLIEYANENGYQLTFSECYRPTLLQKLYLKIGKSWTLKSQHMKRLAVDFNLFIGGRYITSNYDYIELGRYWESLNPYNIWGGRFKDGNHFEMRHDFERKFIRGGKYAKDL